MNASIAARRSRRRRRGFTLIEVLATLLLLAITLPAVVGGITLAVRAAGQAKHRTEASGLARSELNQIVASGIWQQGNTAGDFGSDWPGYHWSLSVGSWPDDQTNAGLQELDLTVTWTDQGKQYSQVLSTIAYVREQQ